MPKCKNNPSRSYTGTEPSPKGLGYCASGDAIGKKRKGKDGNIWIVKEVSNGSGRWVKYTTYNITKLRDLLWNKMYKWWSPLSKGKIIVINKDGTYTITSLDKKKYDIRWKEYGKDMNTKYILWSGMSVDYLYYFIEYILYKCNIQVIEQFVKEKDTLQIIVHNFSKYCVKEEYHSGKDYMLKSYHEPIFKSKKKREIQEEKSKKKLEKKLENSKILKSIVK
jgi:hypothetical protein